MIAEMRPLTEITVEALRLLYKELGIVNTIRFLQQFTNGLGNYTEDRAALFADQTLDDVIKQIKERRQRLSSSRTVRPNISAVSPRESLRIRSIWKRRSLAVV